MAMPSLSMRSPMNRKYAAKAAHGGARRVGEEESSLLDCAVTRFLGCFVFNMNNGRTQDCHLGDIVKFINML